MSCESGTAKSPGPAAGGVAADRLSTSPPGLPTADCGYSIARMKYELVLAPGAVKGYRRLSAFLRAQVRDALEAHLRYEPARESKSRIKRLRGLARPQYRLRVGEIRVYYDVGPRTVEVLAIVTKSDSPDWLADTGEPI